MDLIARLLKACAGRDDAMAGGAALAGGGAPGGADGGAGDRFDRLAEAATRMQRPMVAVFRRNR